MAIPISQSGQHTASSGMVYAWYWREVKLRHDTPHPEKLEIYPGEEILVAQSFIKKTKVSVVRPVVHSVRGSVHDIYIRLDAYPYLWRLKLRVRLSR